MVAQSAQGGHAILRTQSAQGTYATDIATAGIAMRLRNGGIGTDRDLLIPDPEIGGNRDVVDAYVGTAKWSGDYQFYARVDSLLTLLYAALGVKASVTTTGVTTHTLTPSDTAVLPFLSIEEAIGASMEVYNYTDAVVNTLHLEAESNGYLMGTVGFIAAKQTAGNTSNSVATILDQTPLVVGTNITVTYNGVTLPAKSFSMDLNNNFDDSDFRLGSFFLGSLVPKRREMTGTVSIRNQDSTLWRQAVYGNSTATGVTGLSTKQQLIITVSTYENIVGGTPPTVRSLSFTAPTAALKPFNFDPNADDVLDNDIEIEFLRPLVASPLVTVVGKSGLAAIS